MRKKFLSFFVLYTRPVYFVPDLLPRTSIFCSGKKLYQSYMPTGSLQQDKPESLVIYPWRETHTHTQERGRGESLRGDLGTRNNKRKTGPLQILFLCVCVLLLQLYKCERKILERKRWSRLRGACREPTHTHSRRMRATEKEKQHIHVVLIKFCAALLFSRRFLLCSVRLCVCVHTITPRIAALQQKLK